MERLISKIPESETVIRENQKKWESVIEEDYRLVADNVDFNKVGRENYIFEYSGARVTFLLTIDKIIDKYIIQ